MFGNVDVGNCCPQVTYQNKKAFEWKDGNEITITKVVKAKIHGNYKTGRKLLLWIEKLKTRTILEQHVDRWVNRCCRKPVKKQFS